MTYTGSAPTSPVDGRNTAGAAERALRRDLESLHRRAADPAAAVAKALPHLDGAGRARGDRLRRQARAGPPLRARQAAGRFQLTDLVEAIVQPSKMVSDQYAASIVQTADGRVVTGRIVSETPEQLVVVTDPEDATKHVEIARQDVEEVVASSESLMPQGLLDQLNENEVLDLLAYVLCRGNKRDARFKP